MTIQENTKHSCRDSFADEYSRMGFKFLQLFHFFFLLLTYAVHASSTGKSNGVCISPGGHFPPFSSEGKPPKKVAKGPKDLTLCRVFRRSTCCDVAQTYPALLSVRRLAAAGEASQECLHLWELLECSICDPRVGVRSGPPRLCASFCDNLLQSCSNAYFAIDPKTQVLSPCGLSDIVCGRAAEWASNGSELCHLAGFSVQLSDDNSQESFCYGGKASLDSIADSWKTSQSGSSQEAQNVGKLQHFHDWLSDMPFIERISWAVGGMVLTASLVFFSKRKRYIHRQKQAAILRTAKKLEARVSSSFGQGRKKGS